MYLLQRRNGLSHFLLASRMCVLYSRDSAQGCVYCIVETLLRDEK
jgi:hypothetical protein